MVAVLVVVNATTRDTSSPKCFNREGVFGGCLLIVTTLSTKMSDILSSFKSVLPPCLCCV